MSLTLGNPLGSTSASAVSFNQFDIKNSGKSLSTGLKANNDVVSAFIGESLSDKHFILGKINVNMAYSKNAMNVAVSSLSSMAKTIADMLATIAQATGNSDANLATLNDIFTKKMEQLNSQRAAAVFDGRKLLTGDLGQDATIRSAIKNSSLTAKFAAPTANTFKAAGTAAVSTLTAVAVVAGDSITFAGQKYTAVTGEPANENEFKAVTAVPAETAKNLALAIQKNQAGAEAAQAYKISAAGNTVVFTQVSPSTGGIPITPHANMTVTVTTAGASGGIDVSGITNAEGFNKPITFECVGHAADNKALALASGYGNALAKATPAANNNDRAAVFKTVIGGRTFTGALFYPDRGDVNNKEIKMICDKTGESFTVNTAGTYTHTRANLDTIATAQAVAGDLNTFFATATFEETKTLKINTDKGNITEGGNIIGSVKGASAKLTSADFEGLKFKDFKIEDDTINLGRFKFTAIIEGKDPKNPQTYTVSSIDKATLVQGFRLDIPQVGKPTSMLSINLGEKGLTALASTNMNIVANAYKEMMINAGDGLKVRIGLDFEDILKVNFGNVSNDKLFVNDKGEYIKDLKITDPASANIAQEVCTNALRIARSEEQKVKSQIESVQEASDALSRNIQVMKESSDSYLNTDLIEAAQMFSEAVKKMIAAISSLEAGNKVSDAAQRVIQSIA